MIDTSKVVRETVEVQFPYPLTEYIPPEKFATWLTLTYHVRRGYNLLRCKRDEEGKVVVVPVAGGFNERGILQEIRRHSEVRIACRPKVMGRLIAWQLLGPEIGVHVLKQYRQFPRDRQGNPPDCPSLLVMDLIDSV
ncbi:MAG: hypothetical protein ACI9SY_000119 [Candidatus Paceibacteria bacterium]|jgi:hypothetical protein